MIRLLQVFVPVGAFALLFSEVLLTASLFVAVTLWMLPLDPIVFLTAGGGLLRIGLVTASILFGLFFEDLYTRIHVRSRVLLLQQLSFVVGIALLIQGLVSYVDDGLRLPLVVMLPASLLLLAVLFTWRIIYAALVLRVVGPQRILVVGMSPLIEEMAAYIDAHPELGMSIAGYAGNGGGEAPCTAGKVLGPFDTLPQIAAALKPDRIIVGFSDRRRQMPIEPLLHLRYSGFAIEEAASAYERLCGRVVLSELRPAEVVLSSAFRPRPERQAYQTFFNWLAALVLIVVTAPLLMVAVILLKLSAAGPVLSRETHTGLGGVPFRLYRLRFVPKDKSARSRVQWLVRRWHLHALPCLWNVLRGEMCFVGPRPDRREFVEALSERVPFYRQRYRVKPGLTGWAQINIPPDDPEDTLRRLEYDFYYLKNASRGLDTYILVHTLKELLIAPVSY
jgi:lipopolysaccharide/colanic/teichoic acid biosynthesis glycosyltransferase